MLVFSQIFHKFFTIFLVLNLKHFSFHSQCGCSEHQTSSFVFSLLFFEEWLMFMQLNLLWLSVLFGSSSVSRCCQGVCVLIILSSDASAEHLQGIFCALALWTRFLMQILVWEHADYSLIV